MDHNYNMTQPFGQLNGCHRTPKFIGSMSFGVLFARIVGDRTGAAADLKVGKLHKKVIYVHGGKNTGMLK